MSNVSTPVLILFGLTVFCLLMVFLSAFTERTAIFASEKTKAKGALFWLFLVAVCLLAAPAVAGRTAGSGVVPAGLSVTGGGETKDYRLGDISEYERFDPARAGEAQSEWEFFTPGEK